MRVKFPEYLPCVELNRQPPVQTWTIGSHDPDPQLGTEQYLVQLDQSKRESPQTLVLILYDSLLPTNWTPEDLNLFSFGGNVVSMPPCLFGGETVLSTSSYFVYTRLFSPVSSTPSSKLEVSSQGTFYPLKILERTSFEVD